MDAATPGAANIRRVDVEQTMRSAYLSYAMSVITARALPDVRDGLKPVQRRILYAMWDMGLRHDTPTRKCARIVGEVLGKYHPHGDAAVYDALVRLAQDFTMRYPLVHGQGNFGSVDGDAAAAQRYTEARLSAIGEELLLDLDKKTVDLADNFDGSLQEPKVLPAKLPNLLANGGGGIAVGMATNIPPHNLGEVADAIAYVIDHYDQADDITLDELMQFIRGPDFPTGGTILGSDGIRQAYATGHGRVVMRAQVHTEDVKGGHSAIVVTELPYQVNKSVLVERIADLVRNERLQGIGDLRDESDRSGMRVVVELKRGVETGPVLHDLIRLTQLQATFGVNMLALVDGEPRVLSLKRILLDYVEHRHEVLVRRTQFELERALARAHILEGLLVALDHLDEVIDTIRRSRTAETAQDNLMAKFKLSELQARAILDMQLRRLAALERKKIQDEHHELLQRIAQLRDLLAHKGKILGLIKSDVLELKARFGDPRRTRISAESEAGEVSMEELLPSSDGVLLLTRGGQVQRMPLDALRTSKRDLSAWLADALAPGDAPQALMVANARETVLLFTDRGRVFKVPAHTVPDGAQQPKGLPARSVAHIDANESVVALLHVDDLVKEGYVSLGTRQGRVKRLALGELASMSGTSGEVIGLTDGDALGWACLSGGGDELLMVTAAGRAIRFQEDTVRPQGRSAGGMRGISLAQGDQVVAMQLVRPDAQVIVASAYGYTKRTPMPEFSVQGRGGQGVLATDATKQDQAGPLVAAVIANPSEHVILATAQGQWALRRASELPALERASWGRVVSRSRRGAALPLQGDDRLVGLAATERMPRLEAPAEGEGAVGVQGQGGVLPTGAPAKSAKRARPGDAAASAPTQASPARAPSPKSAASDRTPKEPGRTAAKPGRGPVAQATAPRGLADQAKPTSEGAPPEKAAPSTKAPAVKAPSARAPRGAVAPAQTPPRKPEGTPGSAERPARAKRSAPPAKSAPGAASVAGPQPAEPEPVEKVKPAARPGQVVDSVVPAKPVRTTSPVKPTGATTPAKPGGATAPTKGGGAPAASRTRRSTVTRPPSRKR